MHNSLRAKTHSPMEQPNIVCILCCLRRARQICVFFSPLCISTARAHHHRSRLAMAGAGLLRLAALDPQRGATRPCLLVRARPVLTGPRPPVARQSALPRLAWISPIRAPRLAWTCRDGENREVWSARWWWSIGRRESELKQREGGRRVGGSERVCAGQGRSSW